MGRSRKRQPREKKENELESREKQGKTFLTDQEIRRYVALLIVPCVALLVIVVFLISGGFQEESEETTAPKTEVTAAESVHIPVIEPDTKEYIMDFGGSILRQDEVPEINQLMEQYFLSVSEIEMDTFLHLFTSQDVSEEETFRISFERQREYIESYQNISCYTVEGPEPDSFIVYVYYNIKFKDVETLGPSLVQVYAVKCGDGQYRIYDGELSPEQKVYLDQVSGNEDVRLLITQVDREIAEAAEADEELQKRIAFLKNGPPYMQTD